MTSPPSPSLSPAKPAPPLRGLGTVLRLAWPAVAEGLLLTLVFQVDRIMLGHYAPSALASMQVSGPLLWSAISLGCAHAAGAVAVIGRAVGAKDELRARVATEAVVGLALLLGLIFATALSLFQAPLLSLLAGPTASEALRLAARSYLEILVPVLPLSFVGVLATSALQASGDTRSPLLVSLFAQGINVFGDWVLIFGQLGAPALGVQGAAIASAVAFLIKTLLLLAVLMRRTRGARIAWPKSGLLPAYREALAAVLRVSRSAFAEKLIFHLGFLAFIAIISRLGDLAMAANQALLAIESMGFITADGFAVAAGALVAQRLGERRPQAASRAGLQATGLATLLLSLIGVGFLVFPEALLSLFSPDPAIVSLGSRCLQVAAFAEPVMAVGICIGAALRGAGDTRTPMLVALIGPVFVRLLGSYLLAFWLDLGLLGVWLATTLDWTLRAVWLLRVFLRGRWKTLEL